MFILPVKSETFYKTYLQILNGILKLTKTEILVLAQFMDIKDSLDRSNLEIILKDKILFSSENRKMIKDKLDISEHNLNNYIKSLKEKKALLIDEQGYKINPKIFINKKEIDVKFKIKLQNS